MVISEKVTHVDFVSVKKCFFGGVCLTRNQTQAPGAKSKQPDRQGIPWKSVKERVKNTITAYRHFYVSRQPGKLLLRSYGDFGVIYMSFSWDKAEEKMPLMVLSDPLKGIEGFA